MKNIFILLLFCPIIYNFSIKLTLEQKELFSTSSDTEKELMAIKSAYMYFIEFLKEKENSGCYLGESIIPECPEDTVEYIDYLSKRHCFKKCKENEIRKGNVCYKCKNGEKISEKEKSIFGIKTKQIYCGVNKDPEAYTPDEVEKDHCMKNTFYKNGACYKDCSVIGLKSFGLNEYCAIDETDYQQMLNNIIIPHLNYFYKLIVSKIFGFIFGLKEKKDENKMGIIESIKKALFFFNEKANDRYIEKMIQSYKVNRYWAKAHLIYARNEAFSKSLENFLNNQLGADNNIIVKTIKFTDKLYDKMVSDNSDKKIEKIKDKKGFTNVFYKSLMGIIKFFDIFEFSDLISNCYKYKEQGLEQCFDSILNTIEDIDDFYDPYCLFGYVRASVNSNPPICEFKVDAENSDRVLYHNLDPYPKVYKNDWYD